MYSQHKFSFIICYIHCNKLKYNNSSTVIQYYFIKLIILLIFIKRAENIKPTNTKILKGITN